MPKLLLIRALYCSNRNPNTIAVPCVSRFSLFSLGNIVYFILLGFSETLSIRKGLEILALQKQLEFSKIFYSLCKFPYISPIIPQHTKMRTEAGL